ncbi:hypothetical protein [Rhizobium leguminosarum]|jgi:hypothetical protein|uniref:hypothetical protein n=1 Tax=Rhizobium leguminosarum TaxID=384 RepID=UPI002E0DD756|nr:hypothetical protein U8Q02_43320 [Rhizobium leguminosarum]
MIAKYVDGPVQHWMTGYEEAHGVDLSAVVVFVPDGISQRTFSRSCARLEARRKETTWATVMFAKGTDPRVRLIDAETVAAARAHTAEVMGDDYLDRFLQDTLDVAMAEVGRAVWRARGDGVFVTPERFASGIVVEPARSYASRADLRSRPSRYSPSVRLSVALSLDGPCAAVEHHACEIKKAVALCGPVHSYRETGRPHVERLSVLTPPAVLTSAPSHCLQQPDIRA